MNKKWTYLFFMLAVTFNVLGQRGLSRPGGGPGEQGHEAEHEGPSVQIAPGDRLRSWRLLDDFTLVDSLEIDTVTARFQQYNPIYKESFSNVHLGNMGTAYTSNLLSFKKDFNEFIFLNSLQAYFTQPEDIVFYNSKVPYTNLTYAYAAPKRRSEENFCAFFTQNINSRWNLGFKYNLVSSIGAYSSQQADNRNFNFFMSYTAPKYSVHGVLAYNKIEHYQNGGLDGDNHDYILNPGKYDYDQAENIPVKYTDAINFIENYQFFVTQSFGIGKINLNRGLSATPGAGLDNDSVLGNGTDEFYDEQAELPVSTVYHTMQLSTYKRAYSISDLSSYFNNDSLPLYDDNYKYPYATGDTTRYTSFRNTVQIKFNEEANSLLKFGMRAYITNEVKNYRYQTDPEFKTTNGEIVSEFQTANDTILYRNGKKTFVTTHIGGQVFKNIGDNFWWNAGGKIYVQGYKAGDIRLEGNLNTLYKIFKDTAGVYARGKVDLRTPEFLLEEYHSNHYSWENSFKQEKIINTEIGLNIPTRDLRLAFESKSLTDYIYWTDSMPRQTTEFINAFQVSLYKNFKFGPFHSDNKLAYQYSSNQDIYPLPEFVGLSSNYFDFYLAKRVLNVQIGLDVKYHTEYYTPAYMPATGQYYVQNEQKVGDYPFMDAFVNLQLKRARIFVKFDHFNQSLMDRNYFMTIGYPYAPMRIKWGVSWNFYD